MKLLIIVCAILFIAMLLIPVDNDRVNDPIRIIAGTSIEPRADWGDSVRHCLPYGCNI